MRWVWATERFSGPCLFLTNHKSQVTSHKSQITNHKSQITSHKSRCSFAAHQNIWPRVRKNRSLPSSVRP
ncbi:MAG: hypothetical protein DRJ14_09250 [Acidobacteria bacterium]|nr:MAG: hypothetical protein DRJ14_09250 [Acidobacteriota bacterium]